MTSDRPVRVDPRTEPTARPSLVARDAAAVWHPFTQHARWLEDEPVVVDRAEGMYLWDADGRRYLDGVSSLWVTVHGHARARDRRRDRATSSAGSTTRRSSG